MNSPGKKKAIVKLLIVFTTIVAGLFVLESATRLIYDRNGMHYGIEMWKYAKRVKRRSANPALGHEHTPGASARLMGVDVAINSLGLRDREYAPAKPSATYRILVLGDSMTFGWGVAASDTYCTLLEKRLNSQWAPRTGLSYEVVNAGVGNYNTAQEAAYLENRGLQLDPDMILLGYYINDAEPMPAQDAHFLARHSYLYVLTTSGLDAWARQRGSRLTFEEYYKGLYQDAAAGWQHCQAALHRIAAQCKERKLPLIVVLIPELHQTGPAYPFREIHDQVRQVVAANDATLIDLVDAFGHELPHSLWVSAGDAHPNGKAHRIIANEIFERLTELISSPPVP